MHVDNSISTILMIIKTLININKNRYNIKNNSFHNYHEQNKIPGVYIYHLYGPVPLMEGKAVNVHENKGLNMKFNKEREENLGK